MSKITESARGEECQVRISCICTFDPEKTIWSHARWGAAGKGKGIKAPDICGAYACTACDAAYDQLTGCQEYGLERADVDHDWIMGHFRSLVILKNKGLV